MLKRFAILLITCLSQGLWATGKYKNLSDEDQKRGYLAGKYSTPQGQLEKLIKLEKKATGQSTRRGQLVFGKPDAIKSKAALIRQQFIALYCPDQDNILIGFVMGWAANPERENIIDHLKRVIPALKIEEKREAKPQSRDRHKRARHL